MLFVEKNNKHVSVCMMSNYFNTLLPRGEVLALIHDTCSELSINTVGTKPIWCTFIRDVFSSFVISIFQDDEMAEENEIKVEFCFMSGSWCAFCDILKELSCLIGEEIHNAASFSVSEMVMYSPSQEDLPMTAEYVCSLITSMDKKLCLNGLVMLSNVINEKIVWRLGTIYERIIEKGHCDDQEIAATAILCLNKYVNYLVFTEELSYGMCSILERCRYHTPYHVKREALNFAVTLSLKIPSDVRRTGILTFARPNKNDSITFHYVSRLNQVLSYMS